MILLLCAIFYDLLQKNNKCYYMLPVNVQSCDSLRQFKWCLKTFLFGLWDYGAL